MRIVQRLILPLLLLVFSGVPALAQSAGWTVSEAKGAVTIIDARGSRAAKVGAQLAPGDTVRTAAKSSAVLVRGKEFVTMRQNAQLRIAPAQRERGIVQILQDYGSALFNIGKQPNPHFGVDTPYLAAVVKGTTFVITVSDEGASLQVTEGAVETSTRDGGAVELIRPGAVAMIAAADPLRMVIEGEGRKVIDSPARGTGPAAGPAAPAGGAGGSALKPAAADQSAGPRIDEAIVSTPQDFGQVSNGFGSGEVAVLAAVVVSDNARGDANPGNGNGNGNGAGSGDDGVVCAEGNCGNADGADNGNPPVDPGNGNGNGNPPADPGAGNGNGNANGNPPANPGAGGAGNGNPPADSGAGAGNGNGNGNNGNGNGNGGGNGTGNEGNGNGNGSGNGNGGVGGGRGGRTP